MTIDISESSEDFELFHYGIKGMKWGIRRKEGPDGTVSSRFKGRKTTDDTPESDDSKRVKSLRGRKISSLSNQELKDLNKRLDLEQNYSRLTKKPSTLQKGIKNTQTGLTVVGLATTAYKLKDNDLVKAVKKNIFDK